MEQTEPARTQTNSVLILLRTAASLMLLARGFLYLRQRAPWSTLLWRQDWLEGFIKQLLGITWEEYAATSEPIILFIQTSIGLLFIICAPICWLSTSNHWKNSMLYLATAFMLFHTLLRWTDRVYEIPMLIEYSLQWATPLLMLLYGRIKERTWFAVTSVLISLTFVGHGLYAMGLGVARPHQFVNMTMGILGLSENNSHIFLMIFGLFDLLVPVFLLLPYRFKMAALAYGTFWGLLTASARVFAHMTPAENYYGLDPWLAETLVRLPHGLIPLSALLLILQIYRTKKNKESTDSETL